MRTYFYLLLLVLVSVPFAVHGQTSNNNFVPLQPGVPGIKDFAQSNSIPQLLNSIYKICIGVAATLAVLQIMRAGVMYMGGDSITEKKEARNLISMSVIGLILVLSPVVVFSIINPNILSLKIGFNNVKPTSGVASTAPKVGNMCAEYSKNTKAISSSSSCEKQGIGWTKIDASCCKGAGEGTICCGKKAGGIKLTKTVQLSEPAPLGVSAGYPDKAGSPPPENATLEAGMALLRKEASDPTVTLESAYAYLPEEEKWVQVGTGSRIGVVMNLGLIPEFQDDSIYIVHIHPYDLASVKKVPPSLYDILGAAELKAYSAENLLTINYLVVETRGVWKYGVASQSAADTILKEYRESDSLFTASEFFQLPVIKKDIDTLTKANLSTKNLVAIESIVVERALGGEYGATIKQQARDAFGNSVPKNFFAQGVALEYHYYHGEASLSDYINFYNSYGVTISGPQ